MAEDKKKSLKDRLTEYLEPSEESVMLYDEYEDAFMGLGYQQYRGPVAIYDARKCVEILTKNFIDDPDCENEEMAEEMAIEWFDYNTVGAWYGEQTPIFISTRPEDLE